jgi:hypothetical protein
MNYSTLDPVILGHNPFFGIDHLSQAVGNEKSRRFETPRQILEILHCCHELGVRGMMMSTHPRANAVCAEMERESATFTDWRVYPLIPYVNKYVRSANEKGLVNVLLDALSQATFRQKFELLMRGGRGVVGRDIRQALPLLVDIELMPFQRLPLGAVFLHDVLTDLALGLGLDWVLGLFQEHIVERYRVPAGFVTKNLPLLCDRLVALGLPQPVVMASFNAAGFGMNPNPLQCVEVLGRTEVTFVAMNTLASGHLSPETAFRYLAQFPWVRSVVVGVSRKDHATETIHAIRRHLPCANGGRLP